MRCHQLIAPSILAAVAMTTAMAGRQDSTPQFTRDFGISRDMQLRPNGGNRYFSLKPGASVRLEGEDDGQPMTVELTVLPVTRQIRFNVDGAVLTVRTRVVEEREWTNGQLTQVDRLYFACCPETGNVYCFGEHSTQYQNGNVTGHEGTWMAGRDGALPALHMPGSFLLGARYQQELAEGVAMDRAENVEMDVSVSTPAGTFAQCAVVRETTPLEPDEEVLKVYAPGVGLIQDGNLRLVDHHD